MTLATDQGNTGKEDGRCARIASVVLAMNSGNDSSNAADVLADMTGRDREVFESDDVEYPPLEELESVKDDE